MDYYARVVGRCVCAGVSTLFDLTRNLLIQFVLKKVIHQAR